MFSFAVFDPNGGPAGRFTPRHALLFGPDDLPVAAQITFDAGLIRCTKATTDAAGLALQYEVAAADGSGVLQATTLKTCLLPARSIPYLLSLELARYRIMLFLNKLEEWGLVDLPPDHAIIARFEEARQAFTKALVAQRADSTPGAFAGFSREADAMAQRALSCAVEACEQLTLLQAHRQFPERVSGRMHAEASRHFQTATSEKPAPGAPILYAGAGMVTLPGVPTVGCSVSSGVFAEATQKAVAATSDFIAMPMRWIDLEPSEGQYSYTGTDRWIEWAVRTAKIPVHAGPLIDLRPRLVPGWLQIWENDYETLRDMVIEHLQNVVTRYRRTVARWTVCSGLHVNTHFKLSFEQIMDLTRVCVGVVRKLHPTGKVQVELAQPWGEYHATNKKTLPPLLYAEAINQSGLSFDAFGLRVQLGAPEGGQSWRDLMALSALVDRYAALERPIAITALGCPSAPVPPRAGVNGEDMDPGRWNRAGPSEASQADWLTKAAAILLAKPFVHSVCWHELADYPPQQAPEMAFGGLVTGQGVLKPSGKRLAEIRRCIAEARSPLPLAGVFA